ncbi:MAG: response regulator transcription factor [Rhodoferax sp.]|jgi:DNA-binding NarL/FixJ family response regulator|nr:response regulator transcription factor [Rhodoferax sp.]MBP9930384.1 response regulator transcription factor [Rhodoferax sp.]HQX58894.1 response regulator [Burkholderiaceae bacterium]HQZ06780.1 response regulator [Burkholderiaceae bacterium]HRA63721.1 response regulator [Burkholderiaceae bacterium]
MSVLRTYIVEDNPIILRNLSETLEELTDVQVVGSAADEGTAVDCMRNDTPGFDLMIIDMFLASGSGLAVLRSAQALNVQARRIVLTNYATPDIRRRCTALGADRVFDKSSQIEDLLDYCISISDGTAAGAVQLH